MKKILILLLASMSLFCYADPDEIVLNNGGSGDNRGNISLRVFYDNETQEIVLQGDNHVSYYNVIISYASTGDIEITTNLSGNYDTIDISSLAPGLHVITIESPSGNIYEGTFTSY